LTLKLANQYFGFVLLTCISANGIQEEVAMSPNSFCVSSEFMFMSVSMKIEVKRFGNILTNKLNVCIY